MSERERERERDNCVTTNAVAIFATSRLRLSAALVFGGVCFWTALVFGGRTALVFGGVEYRAWITDK